MVVTKLTGGLGNQMFQYAAGRILSLNFNAELYLDVTEYAKVKMHNGYELGKFCIQENIFKRDIYDIAYLKNEKIYRLLNKIKKSKFNYYKEKNYFVYDEGLAKATTPAYLDGYWQSYRYLDFHKSQLLKDFEFRTQPNEKNQNLINRMGEISSVAVHIRRGDYLSNKEYSRVHNVLELDYYDDAFKLLKNKISDPQFYIFSDDIDWAKENISIDSKCTFIHNPKESSIEDLRLMKSCKHNIIANSTFSWWGAWLNSHPNKIVIAPKKWLKTNLEQNSDLIPKEWMRI